MPILLKTLPEHQEVGDRIRRWVWLCHTMDPGAEEDNFDTAALCADTSVRLLLVPEVAAVAPCRCRVSAVSIAYTWVKDNLYAWKVCPSDR